MKTFISSTIQDMRPERDAVTEVMNTLKQEISRSEFFVASERSSKEICIQEAGSSDIFIGIYKNCYGSIPTDDNPNNYSVPEMEYNVARENNKRILIFISSEEKDRDQHLREFLEKIQN